MMSRKPWPKWAFSCSIHPRGRFRLGRFRRAPSLAHLLRSKRTEQFEGNFRWGRRRTVWRNGFHMRLYRRALGGEERAFLRSEDRLFLRSEELGKA